VANAAQKRLYVVIAIAASFIALAALYLMLTSLG